MKIFKKILSYVTTAFLAIVGFYTYQQITGDLEMSAIVDNLEAIITAGVVSVGSSAGLLSVISSILNGGVVNLKSVVDELVSQNKISVEQADIIKSNIDTTNSRLLEIISEQQAQIAESVANQNILNEKVTYLIDYFTKRDESIAGLLEEAFNESEE